MDNAGARKIHLYVFSVLSAKYIKREVSFMSKKRIMQRCVALVTVFVMVLGCLGFQAQTTDVYAASSGMSVVCAKRTIAVNCTTTIKTSVPATFKSSDTTVAIVGSKGLVVGKKAGTAKITITAKSNKKLKRIVTITVKNQLVVKSPASGAATLYAGHSTTIKTNIPATFKSLNTAVATVDRTTGKVVAKKAGTAKIKLTAKSNSKLTAVVTITVKTPLVVTAPSSGAATLYVGHSTTIKTNIAATFKSSNTKVATVDSTGKVVAKKSGTSVIAVKAKSNPKLVKVVKITVKNTLVIISPDNCMATITAGESISVMANMPAKFDLESTCEYFVHHVAPGEYAYTCEIDTYVPGTITVTVTAKSDPRLVKKVYITVAKPVAEKNEEDVAALTEIIDDLNSQGMSLPTNLDDDCYTWTDTRITGINWYDKVDKSSDNVKARTLNLGKLTTLEDLDISYNNIADLDIRDCKKLQSLACDGNALMSLDVSNCTSLRTLSCSSNALRSLDLSNCTSLITLACTLHAQILRN